MLKVLKRIGALIIDLIYPPFCIRCGRMGTLICERCYSHLNFSLTDDLVPSLFTADATPVYLEKISALLAYDEMMKKIMHHFKYQGARDLFVPLAYWLYQYGNWDADVITFIPIHKKRRLERGYNQAELVAQELARLSGIPCISLLTRPVYRQKQALSKSKSERLKKTKDIFAAVAADVDKEKTILIIDDVVTSGATLNEAARVLHEAGFQHVKALAIAHGE